MASKAGTRANGKVPSGTDVAWVNYNLTPDQKTKLKSSEFDPDSAAIRIIEEGYKLSFGYDERNECFTCFIIPKTPGHRNTGMILSGRGSTPIKAFKQACYIHWECFDGDWSDARMPVRDELDD